MTRAIPPGFSSRLEAIERAERKWGRRDAMGKLKGFLVSGELIGWDGLSSRVQTIDLEFWAKEGSWGVLEGERTSLHRGRNPFLLFKQEDLDRVFPSAEGESLDSAETESKGVGEVGGQISARHTSTRAPKKPSGRPPNANADDFWIEAARMVYNREQGDAGQTQREFIDSMFKWSQKKMDDPYKESTVETKIEALWRRLKLGNQRE